MSNNTIPDTDFWKTYKSWDDYFSKECKDVNVEKNTNPIINELDLQISNDDFLTLVGQFMCNKKRMLSDTEILKIVDNQTTKTKNKNWLKYISGIRDLNVAHDLLCMIERNNMSKLKEDERQFLPENIINFHDSEIAKIRQMLIDVHTEFHSTDTLLDHTKLQTLTNLLGIIFRKIYSLDTEDKRIYNDLAHDIRTKMTYLDSIRKFVIKKEGLETKIKQGEYDDAEKEIDSFLDNKSYYNNDIKELFKPLKIEITEKRIEMKFPNSNKINSYIESKNYDEAIKMIDQMEKNSTNQEYTHFKKKLHNDIVNYLKNEIGNIPESIDTNDLKIELGKTIKNLQIIHNLYKYDNLQVDLDMLNNLNTHKIMLKRAIYFKENPEIYNAIKLLYELRDSGKYNEFYEKIENLTTCDNARDNGCDNVRDNGCDNARDNAKRLLLKIRDTTTHNTRWTHLLRRKLLKKIRNDPASCVHGNNYMNKCMVCLESKSDLYFVPCSENLKSDIVPHGVICKDCCESIISSNIKCPVCSSDIKLKKPGNNREYDSNLNLTINKYFISENTISSLFKSLCLEIDDTIKGIQFGGINTIFGEYFDNLFTNLNFHKYTY